MSLIAMRPQPPAFLIVCFLFLSGMCHAQITLSGKVVDETNTGLPAANLLIQGSTEGTFCDADGNFTLQTEQPLPLTLEVTFVGYRTALVPIDGPRSDLFIVMEFAPGNEIVISASRKPEMVQEAPAAVSLISARKLEADLVVDPMLSLRNLPGVDIAQYSPSGGQINLRGRSDVFQTETFIIADYRNMVIPNLGFLVFGQHPVDALDLERVEVVKGPGSALYGPGVEAGVVHFISKDPFRHEGTSFSIGAGNQEQFTSSFRHALKLSEKFAYKITGQYRSSRDFELDPNDPNHAARIASYVSPIRSAKTGEPQDFVVPDYDQRTYGFTGTLVYKPNENTTLTAVGGFGVYEGIFRTTLGEGYAGSGRPFAQLRLDSGGLFAQAYWAKGDSKDGEVALYSSGITSINISDQLETQLQYNFPWEDKPFELTIGGDFRSVWIDTENTTHGRFEDDDDYSILGLYAQGTYKISEQWKSIAALRFDSFTALEETTLAPRLGLVYQPNRTNTLRLTWNKAFGAPTSLNLYGDTQLADTGSFLIYLVNGVEDLSFDQGNGYNFITQSYTPNGDIPLIPLYGLVTSGFQSMGSFPQPLLDYLFSLTPSIGGSTAALNTSTPLSRAPLELSESDMFELGYKGVLGGKWIITTDIYYSRRQNLLSGALPISPFLIYPTAGNDLATVVAATADPDVLDDYGLTPESLAAIYNGVITGIFTDDTGAPAPLGVLSSDNSPTTSGTYDFAYLNYDELDYWGVDMGIEYFLYNDLTLFGNVSWLSRNYWEELSLNRSNLTAPLSLNVPDTRIKFGFNKYAENGWFYNAAARITTDWESVNGADFTGPVDGYFVVDAGVGYAFDKVRIGITATNLFDEKYRPIFAAPDIRRLILVKAIVEL